MQNIKRIYRSTEAELIQDADAFIDIMERDKLDIINYGITDFTRAKLISLRNTLRDTTTDAVMLAYVAAATEDKNIAEGNLQEAIRQAVGRAFILWGEDSMKYRIYNVGAVSLVKGGKLVRLAISVKTILAEQQEELAEAGFTQLMMDDFSDLIEDLDKKIDLQGAAIRKRDFEVDVRVIAGNAVYEFMKPISKAGKLCYEKTFPSLANDYNLTHTHPHPTIQIVEGEVPATQGTSTTVMDSEANTSLELINTGTGPLTFFYAENITDITGPTEVVIAAGESLTIKASGLGFLVSVRQRLNVFNPGPDDGSYRVEWV